MRALIDFEFVFSRASLLAGFPYFTNVVQLLRALT